MSCSNKHVQELLLFDSASSAMQRKEFSARLVSDPRDDERNCTGGGASVKAQALEADLFERNEQMGM